MQSLNDPESCSSFLAKRFNILQSQIARCISKNNEKFTKKDWSTIYDMLKKKANELEEYAIQIYNHGDVIVHQETTNIIKEEKDNVHKKTNTIQNKKRKRKNGQLRQKDSVVDHLMNAKPLLELEDVVEEIKRMDDKMQEKKQEKS